MKKVFLLFLVFFPLCLFALDNDFIILEKEQIECIIKEITDDEVKYVHADNPDVLYTTSKSNIRTIVFKNGVVQHFQEKTIKPVEDVKEEEKIKLDVVSSKNEIIENNSVEEKGRIYRDKNNYVYNDTYITVDEVERIMKKYDADCYHDFVSARKMYNGGMITLAVGAGLALGSLSMLSMPGLAITTCSVGAIVGVTGGIVAISGAVKLEKSIDRYNGMNTYLSYYISPNTVGVAIHF